MIEYRWCFNFLVFTHFQSVIQGIFHTKLLQTTYTPPHFYPKYEDWTKLFFWWRISLTLCIVPVSLIFCSSAEFSPILFAGTLSPLPCFKRTSFKWQRGGGWRHRGDGEWRIFRYYQQQATVFTTYLLQVFFNQEMWQATKKGRENVWMNRKRRNNLALQLVPNQKTVSFGAREKHLTESKDLIISAKEAPQLIRILFVGFIILFPFIIFVALLRIQPESETTTKAKKLQWCRLVIVQYFDLDCIM